MTDNLVHDEFVKLWENYIYPKLIEALEKTPEDKLDWAPAENMITLGYLFLHIAECSDWWYSEVMCKQDSVELAFADRPCPSKDIIGGHMEKHKDRMRDLFSLEHDKLAEIYSFKGRDKLHEMSGYWIFTHMIEHDIHHRSQINQYLRILGIKPPEI